ncbi:Shikimate O-hydroxycinnamoyltransferase [Cytospora mali]|uniref:Shikimate O-hydroxycinnamoyltransferase n=1 Tax=Cytospora mali TaxID=578113 RepID=A0A194VP51_CYTMA|nr:Shikimate O-hydroxycinnamoyltransferase [Valsa mali]
MAPRQEVFQIHPFGWENDPEEERFNATTLDYLAPCTYNNYAIFFKLEDTDKAKTIDILKAGLERTIAQARHYCCIIEKDTDYGHSFVKKNDSTVRLFVQYLDDPRDGYPTIQDFERSNFSAVTMDHLKLWSVDPMTYGENPEAHPDNRPVASAFKAKFIRGGMVLHIHHHHYSNDVMGWADFTHQLSENCHAFANNTIYPPWGSKNLGLSKAAELKKFAKPEDGTWVSTYDTFSAFIWRTLTRVRMPGFNHDLSSKLFWAEAIEMRRRMQVPARIQHNVMFAALSPTAPVEQPTAGEVVSEWPLWKVARYIRQLTNAVTEENLSKTLDMVATVRDKMSLNIQIDAKPPLSMLMTDHRDAKITETDWGFAKPITNRHVIDDVGIGVIVVYPPRDLSPESDEGPEFAVFYEKRLAQTLINDAEWNKYFEYRGVDAEDTSAVVTEEVKSIAITA